MEQDNFSNEFEAEAHADDDLHCAGCNKKISYCHGDSEYCSHCEKWINEGYEMNDKGEWERRKRKLICPEDENDREDYD